MQSATSADARCRTWTAASGPGTRGGAARGGANESPVVWPQAIVGGLLIASANIAILWMVISHAVASALRGGK